MDMQKAATANSTDKRRADDKALATETASENTTVTHAKDGNLADLLKMQTDKGCRTLSKYCSWCMSGKCRPVFLSVQHAVVCNKKRHIWRACKTRTSSRCCNEKYATKVFTSTRRLSVSMKSTKGKTDKSIKVAMMVNGTTLTMELGTGVPYLSVILAKDCNAIFGPQRFQKTTAKLWIYTGEQLSQQEWCKCRWCTTKRVPWCHFMLFISLAHRWLEESSCVIFTWIRNLRSA